MKQKIVISASFFLCFCFLILKTGNAVEDSTKLQKGISVNTHCTPEKYSTPQEQNTIVSYGNLCTPNPSSYCRSNQCPEGTISHDGN